MPAHPPGPFGPVSSVGEAIARMEFIAASTSSGDGLACFNRMYLEVTTEVGRRIGQGFFTDPDFMTRLDVTFANLYFDAADAARQSETVPLAWRPLIEERANIKIEPIQFALAGMNAHINTEPQAGTHHADYQRVDRLLDAAEQSVRQSFESAAERAVDQHLQAVEDLVANWAINSARDLAWNNALLLWGLRDDAVGRGLFLDGLAAAAAQASQLLLAAV